MRALIGMAMALAAAAGIWLVVRSGERVRVELAPREALAPGARSGAKDASTSDRLHGADAAPHADASTRAPRAGEPSAREPDAPREALEVADPSRDLVVRVVDRAGSPVADLPLALRRARGDERDPLDDERSRRTTGPQGEARFEGVLDELRSSDPPFRLVHEVAFETRPELALDAATLADVIVLSVQPPWCSVEVLVHELEGDPAPEGTSVALELVNEGEALDPELVRSRPSFDANAIDGRAFFRFAEPGREFEATAARNESNVRSRCAARASASIGGTARLSIVLGSDHPVVRFRAVDETGAPMARAALRVEPEGWLALEGDAHPRTDSGGRFELDVESGWIFGAKRWLVTHELADGAVLQGRAKAPDSLEKGLNEGGDVVLERSPLLVAGRVVDAAGRAVEGAKVVAGEQSDQVWFGSSPSVRGSSAADGSFELRGVLSEEEFEVSARFHGDRSDAMRVQAGARGVTLALRPRWTLSGRIALDAGFDPSSFELALLDAMQHETTSTHAADDASFSFGETPEGVYALLCRYDGEELARLEGIQVAGDTDAGSLDLRGLLARCEVRLVGAEDPDALDVSYAWRPSGSEGEWRERNARGARFAILSRSATIDLSVHPHGYRGAELEGVSGEREIALQPALRVRLELVTDAPLPSAPYVFDATLESNGHTAGWAQGPAYFTEANRSVLFLVSAPGHLRVGWHLERRGPNWAVGGGVLDDETTEIDVLDVPGEQRFRIELRREVLEELVAHPPW